MSVAQDIENTAQALAALASAREQDRARLAAMFAQRYGLGAGAAGTGFAAIAAGFGVTRQRAHQAVHGMLKHRESLKASRLTVGIALRRKIIEGTLDPEDRVFDGVAAPDAARFYRDAYVLDEPVIKPPPAPVRLTGAQFDCLAKIGGFMATPSLDGARLVLVNGMDVSNAARAVDAPAQNISRIKTRIAAMHGKVAAAFPGKRD